MLEYMTEQMRGEPWISPSSLISLRSAGPALAAMRSQYPALAAAPAIVQEALLFPYLKGASFVAALWKAREGRPEPFWRHLPQSTEQVLVEPPGPSRGPKWTFRRSWSWSRALDSRRSTSGSSGRGELEVLFVEHLGEEGRGLARGWDGA